METQWKVEGIEEVKELSKIDGETTEVVISCFGDQVSFVLTFIKLMGIKEYTTSGGIQRNSGYAGDSQPLIIFNVPKSNDVGILKLSLGVFGNELMLSW